MLGRKKKKQSSPDTVLCMWEGQTMCVIPSEEALNCVLFFFFSFFFKQKEDDKTKKKSKDFLEKEQHACTGRTDSPEYPTTTTTTGKGGG